MKNIEQKIIPVEERKGKKCFFCGTDKSVKYFNQLAGDDLNSGFSCCSGCQFKLIHVLAASCESKKESRE